MILPLRKFEKQSYSCTFDSVNQQGLKFLAISVTILCLYAIVFFASNIKSVLAISVVEVRSSQDAVYESSIYSKIAVLGAFLSPVALFLYFYNQVQLYLSKTQSLLLFVSSLSFVFYTLCVAGRDGIIIWIFTYISCICLFYHHINRDARRKIVRIIIGCTLLLAPIFMFISNERFSSSDSGVMVSMLDYLGKQLYILSEKIDTYLNTGIGNLFPTGHFYLLEKVLGLFGYASTSHENRFDNMDYLFNAGYEQANQFSYFVGSFYPANTNLLILITFIAICVLVYKLNLKILKGKISTSGLMCAFVWYMIPIVGVFYFYYGSLIGNVFLLMPFIIKIFF